jgi:adenosylcobyric acid synthase
MGSYLHGMFHEDGFRTAFLRQLGAQVGQSAGYGARVEATLDALAAHIAQHMDIDALLALAR